MKEMKHDYRDDDSSEKIGLLGWVWDWLCHFTDWFVSGIVNAPYTSLGDNEELNRRKRK